MRRHPEARAELIKSAAEERLESSTPDSWRWPLGWRIRLFGRDGSIHTRDTSARTTYREARSALEEELADPRYESAVLLRLEAHHS